MKTLLLSALSLLVAQTAFASTWEIDPAHSNAGFTVKHMMISTVRGEFQNVTGTVEVDDKDVTKSKIDVSIDATTINTRVAKRDTHLKGADFFDVTKFPTITFKSTKVEKNKEGKLLVTGDLTMHGITKPVTLTVNTLTEPVKGPFGNTARGVQASGKVNRKDFGLIWNKSMEAGGVLVGDEVDLVIDAELNPKTPAKT